MKKLFFVNIVYIFILILFSGCSKKAFKKTTFVADEVSVDEKVLPEKLNPVSMLMSESPVNPFNIDDYLFRDDCIYIDLRSPDSFYKEGHIAGFINVPFYGYIAGFPGDKKSLFEMVKKKGAYLGDKGTFIDNYTMSRQLVFDMFDKNKKIIAVSTAGVESCYFLNLLSQLGYKDENLYNCGSFTNGMGQDIAYRTYSNAKYLVKGFELFDTKVRFDIMLDNSAE